MNKIVILSFLFCVLYTAQAYTPTKRKYFSIILFCYYYCNYYIIQSLLLLSFICYSYYYIILVIIIFEFFVLKILQLLRQYVPNLTKNIFVLHVHQSVQLQARLVQVMLNASKDVTVKEDMREMQQGLAFLEKNAPEKEDTNKNTHIILSYESRFISYKNSL